MERMKRRRGRNGMSGLKRNYYSSSSDNSSKASNYGKIIYVLLDGVGDLPHPSLNHLTPLESAYTPNLDALARKGRMGMVYTVGKDIAPESDIAVFSMLGYTFRDKDYPGRGMVEAIGAGIDVRDGDLAMRGNFATVDDEGRIVDRRVGRNLADDEAKELVKAIKDGVRLDGAEYELVHTRGHRVVLRIRSKSSLSAEISNTDPAYERIKGMGVAKEEHATTMSIDRCKALSKSKGALLSARLVNEFTEQVISILEDHPVNRRRRGMGMLEANCILLRDAGNMLPRVEPIASKYNARFACIVDMPVEHGIARVTGMSMLDGGSMRDYEIKARRAIEALSNYDVIYVHLKGPDEFGHDGNARGKEESIEEIDERFFGELLRLGNSSTRDRLFIVVSGDHSTPCTKKAHSADPVPLLVSNQVIKDDGLGRFTEREAGKGSIGYIMGYEVLSKVFNIIISSNHNK
ncbi:MAG: alkaline phosphatase family protein [Candidatus Nitrosocaldus sp.]